MARQSLALDTPYDVSLPDFIDAAARARPGQIALSWGKKEWTFVRLQQSVSAASDLLASELAPHRPGGRIGILSANRPGFVVAVHTAARLGKSFVPLNWRLTSSELAWQLHDAGVTLLLADESRIAVAKAASADLDLAIHPISVLEEPTDCRYTSKCAPRIDLSREAAVLFTSGTSGRPKGARLTYGNLWFSAIGSTLHLGHHQNDVWLAALPCFHIGGLSILYRGLLNATSIVLLDRFAPDAAIEVMERGVTLASFVPTMLRKMIDHHGEAPWPASLRCALLGGATAPRDLIESCLGRGIPVAPTYGLTEASSQAATLRPAEVVRKSGSSGLPLPTTELRIVEQGHALAPNQIGEIELRGPTLFAGYLGHTSPPTTNDHWFATGDAGYFDEDGFLYVVDRRDDVIVSGGENVYPAEVERVLLEHPLVADAAVIGQDDQTWGRRPIAVVVWQGHPQAAESMLLAHCRSRLAAFKVPLRIVFRTEIPRSPSGKLLRNTVRQDLMGSTAIE